MLISRLRNELINYCSTELKSWTRETRRLESLGRGIIGLFAKLPMRDASAKMSNQIYIYIRVYSQNSQPEFVWLFASAPADL